ncbi:MAG: glycerol uptake facilitator protein, partial [Actinomycetota bacterium]|nr:glycerol uptake facilitator protein [Actinomycetota bacterium]
MVDSEETSALALDLESEAEIPLGKRLLAEFIGTLLFVGVGTGAATFYLLGPMKAGADAFSKISDIFQGGDPAASRLYSSLHGSYGGDVLPVALAFAFMLAVLVYSLGGISGAHFNPAVTFSLAVARRFRWREVPLYWVVQCVGGILGALVVAGIYGQQGASFNGSDILFGATTVSVDIWNAILSEAFITFILVLAIMAIAVDPRAPKGWSGLVIGLALGAGILVTAGATGGSANFARSLGPFVASWVNYDVGVIPWHDLIVYAVGPLIGGAAAALVYESLSGLELISPAPRPGAATGGVDAVLGESRDDAAVVEVE